MTREVIATNLNDEDFKATLSKALKLIVDVVEPDNRRRSREVSDRNRAHLKRLANERKSKP